MNYKELTKKLVNRCLKLGADDAEVYLQVSRNLSVNILNGEIETIEEASAHGVGFRLFIDGKMGFSHCNDFSNDSFDDTIRKALAFARLTTTDPNNVLPSDNSVADVNDLFDPEIATLSMEEKIKKATLLETLAMKDPRITKSSGSGFGESEREIFIANSNGISKSYKSSSCSLGVSVVAEKGDQKNSGGEYCSRRFISDLLSPEEIASAAAKKAWEMLDPRMVKTQKAPVIFDPNVARSLLGGVISALNGERVLQGASFLKDMMEQSFASQLLTITDDGTRPKGVASSPFDGEGVPTQKRLLVEKGVLKSFIHNTSSARRAGTVSTGNASRRAFSQLPGIGTHNLSLEAGRNSRNEIIASTARGLLLKGVTGYGINAVNGNFSGGASGFWIEGGEIAYPVKGLTIAGSADAILNGIDMMGSDIDQNLSFAAPTFRVAEMQIGGR